MPMAALHLPPEGRLEESAVEEPGKRVHHRVALDVRQGGALDDRGLREQFDVEEGVEGRGLLVNVPAGPQAGAGGGGGGGGPPAPAAPAPQIDGVSCRWPSGAGGWGSVRRSKPIRRSTGTR